MSELEGVFSFLDDVQKGEMQAGGLHKSKLYKLDRVPGGKTQLSMPRNHQTTWANDTAPRSSCSDFLLRRLAFPSHVQNTRKPQLLTVRFCWFFSFFFFSNSGNFPWLISFMEGFMKVQLFLGTCFAREPNISSKVQHKESDLFPVKLRSLRKALPFPQDFSSSIQIPNCHGSNSGGEADEDELE